MTSQGGNNNIHCAIEIFIKFYKKGFQGGNEIMLKKFPINIQYYE